MGDRNKRTRDERRASASSSDTADSAPKRYRPGATSGPEVGGPSEPHQQQVETGPEGHVRQAAFRSEGCLVSDTRGPTPYRHEDDASQDGASQDGASQDGASDVEASDAEGSDAEGSESDASEDSVDFEMPEEHPEGYFPYGTTFDDGDEMELDRIMDADEVV